MSNGSELPSERRVALGLAIAWALALAAVVLVVARYDALPDPLPMFRSLTGDRAIARHKTPLVALRVPLIGIVQLVFITALALVARSAAAPGWLRLFLGTALAIGAKAIFEAGELLLLGTDASLLIVLARAGAVLSVVALAVFATILWRRGALRRDRFPLGNARPRWLTPVAVACLAAYVFLVAASL